MLTGPVTILNWRQWNEVIAALTHMVAAAKALRAPRDAAT
jgi:methionine synthase II (cobalamin-independent)